MTLRYDLVVFDFDGTLADSLTWFRTALGDVVEHHGLPPVCDEKAESLRGLGPKEILEELSIPTWKVPFIAADVRKRAAENIDKITLYDGVSDMLRAIDDSGIEIAMVSSNGEEAVRAVLGLENSNRVSQFACGAAIFGKSQAFKKVIRKANTRAERTLSIGDEVRDIEAARESGTVCAAVTWGFATAEILTESKPDYLFDKVAEIIPTATAQARKLTDA
ncbi:MAG: HAD hydrolase-like protein [Maricaulis sp.]|nr:HAD hydrolase-like protein [Maricaulis sp.]